MPKFAPMRIRLGAPGGKWRLNSSGNAPFASADLPEPRSIVSSARRVSFGRTPAIGISPSERLPATDLLQEQCGSCHPATGVTAQRVLIALANNEKCRVAKHLFSHPELVAETLGLLIRRIVQ